MSVFAHKTDKSKFNLGNESDLTGIGDGTPFNAIKKVNEKGDKALDYAHEIIFNTNTLKLDVERVGKTVIFNIFAYNISTGENPLFTVDTSLKPAIFQRAALCSSDGKNVFIYINTDGVLGVYAYEASAIVMGQIVYVIP